MPFIPEISIDWFQSPRVVNIAAPVTEVSVQDMYDTLRILESRAFNLIHDPVVTAGGKEALGGGLTVAITMTLQNAVVNWEDRGSPTVTRISGGNIVAVDENGDDLGTGIMQFSTNIASFIAQSSSATAIEQELLQQSAFLGGVAVNTISGTAGTTFPTGTREQPSSNFADALTIANERGLRIFYITASCTIDTEDFSNGYVFIGDSQVTTTLTLDTSADLSNCEFRNATVTGILDNDSTMIDCVATNITVFNGKMINCGLADMITLGAGADAGFIDCHSAVPGGQNGQLPYIDMGGATSTDLLIRHYAGGIGISNCADASVVGSIDMDSGRVIFDADVTEGTFTVRGVARVTDNSTSNATIVDETLTPTTISTGILDSLLTGHFSPDSVGEALTLIRGLVQQNYVLDSTEFNASGIMTSARIRLFDTKTNTDNATDGGVAETGEIAVFNVTATAEGTDDSQLALYKVTRE